MIAGILAGLAHTSVTLTSYKYNIAKYRWLDYASGVIFGNRPKSIEEAVFSEIAMFGWSGVLGTIFALAMPHINDHKNYRLKGIGFGLSSWFGIYAITKLSKFDSVRKTDINTAVVHAVSAGLWGLILTETLNKLEKYAEKPQMDNSSGIRDYDERWHGSRMQSSMNPN
jgi:hypothetical protein